MGMPLAWNWSGSMTGNTARSPMSIAVYAIGLLNDYDSTKGSTGISSMSEAAHAISWLTGSGTTPLCTDYGSTFDPMAPLCTDYGSTFDPMATLCTPYEALVAAHLHAQQHLWQHLRHHTSVHCPILTQPDPHLICPGLLQGCVVLLPLSIKLRLMLRQQCSDVPFQLGLGFAQTLRSRLLVSQFGSQPAGQCMQQCQGG
eukprot:1143281-Pelagomonas_calceolata.AAC.10